MNSIKYGNIETRALPLSFVRKKTQELSLPSPFRVNPNILMQYQANGFTLLLNTVTYVSPSIMVSNRGHNFASSSTGFFICKVALIFMCVSLNPRMMPLRSCSGIDFHLTRIEFLSVFTAVISCGGESGAEDKEKSLPLFKCCSRNH